MYEGHQHLEGLRRLFSGRGGLAEAEEAASHLIDCRQCWLLAARAMAAERADGVLAVPGPLKWVADLQEMEQARLVERLEAQAAWAEIRSLSTKARRDKVRLTRSLHTLGTVEVLLEEGATAGAPVESEELFYLALLVAGQLPFPKFSAELKNDLCAECCSEISNARRRQAKWAAARDALDKGSQYVERGSGDGVAEGKVLHYTGALEDDLGNTGEAARLLRRAASLFEAASETFLRSKTLVKLAYTLADGDPSESLRVIEQALAVIPANHPRLAWFAEIIRINCLVTMGAPLEALLRFNGLKELQEQFREPFMQLRGRFTAARLLEHLGRPQKAEIRFQEVIAGDLEHGFVKDFCLDLVYLLGFHLRRGQTSEAIAVCRRASEELSVLDDEEGTSELARDQMQAVWRSLEEEVKKGTVDLGATTVLKSYIKAHWRTPASEAPSFKA
jgi:tetratricopeptide (TPR) repeat protein